MSRFKGCFSDHVFMCLFLLTLNGRILGQGKEPVVEEGSDVVLPCFLSTKENIEFMLFDWKKDGQKEVFMYNAGIHYNNGPSDTQDPQFRGRVSHFEDELKHGNASIIIRNTKVADSGDYTCVFPLLQPEPQTFHIKLVVDGILKDRSGENIPGAASEPSVTTLKRDNEVLLQCEVVGVSPKPKVEWKDSSGNIVPAEEPKVTERGGSYDIILQAAVTKMDHYRCVVTQEEIYHQIYSEIYVPLGNSNALTVAVSVFSILLVVLLFVV